MPCVELRIDQEQAWEPRKGFLGLPRELRDIIYELVLVEPPKWERRHKAICDHCPRNTKTFERPVFDHFEGCSCQQRKACPCGLRSAGLLGVNRQLHRETAPIFWTKNVFAFDRAGHFAEDVGENLRAEYREMLQHVSILGVHWEEFQQASWPDICYTWDDHMGSLEMWTALKGCSGLRTLEIGPEKLCCPEWRDDPDEDDDEDEEEEDQHDYTEHLPTIREQLPLLEEFAFARTLVYDGNPASSRRNLSWYDMPKMAKRHLLYVKARKAIDLDTIDTTAKAKDAARAFRTNYLVHIKFAIETSLLGLPEADFSTSDSTNLPIKYALPGGIDETNTHHELKLRDGTSAEVRLLGLPITKRTQLQHIKQRWKEDARRKQAGKPSLWEEKLNAVVQERKDTKKGQEEEKEERARGRDLTLRARREEEIDEDDKRDERRTKRKERVEVRKTNMVNETVKKMERKRVPRPK